METDESEISGLSLQDLSNETGVEPRTIRSYVEKGVIPGPESLGRGARYPRETLDRLKVLQLLRDANRAITLDQVRVLLQGIGPSHMRSIAAGDLRVGAVIDSEALAAGQPPKNAALKYLRNIRSPTGIQGTPTWQASTCSVPRDDQLPVLESAARALAALVGLPASSRSSRGENWYRISLTPDIELSVRGEFDTEQLAQLHRIGDSLRTLLTKGPSK